MPSDIKHSLLTATDREFLRGEKEYDGENAKNQRYERRENIKARIERGIEDLVLLADQPRGVHGRMADIPNEKWDTALEALYDLHPDPPDRPDPDELRSMAQSLTEKADRLETDVSPEPGASDDAE